MPEAVTPAATVRRSTVSQARDLFVFRVDCLLGRV